jgi:thiol-disulfide isomerase/thioredoxin
VIVIAGFGISLLIPQFQLEVEKLFSKLSGFMPKGNTQAGFFSGLIVGLSLGLLWTPCVGPILASVISLAITGTVTFDSFIITFFYSLGTAIPMFLIISGGQTALRRVPWLLANTAKIQKTFGVVMIVTAVGIFFNIDRAVQSYFLTTFPQYGANLTQFEDNTLIKGELEKVKQNMPTGPLAPSIVAGGEWFNSPPLTLSELKGKVVLVDFWTYTCINCQRTLPYVKEWWSKYKDSGLIIIGVHSPEFEFEKDKNNLRKAIADFGLTYPIVQDNNFATWRNFSNQYWPAKYLIDKDGVIRYSHFGEGNYDETEKVIQELLKETGAKNIPTQINNQTSQTYAQTPETYVGYDRIAGFASNETIHPNELFSYSAPAELPQNNFALSGKWTVMGTYAIPQKGSELSFNFSAQEVYLVMKVADKPAKVKVYVDGKMQYFGKDVINGEVTVDADRLYTLIHLPSAGRHILKLIFEDNNAELFAFTFG